MYLLKIYKSQVSCLFFCSFLTLWLWCRYWSILCKITKNCAHVAHFRVFKSSDLRVYGRCCFKSLRTAIFDHKKKRMRRNKKHYVHYVICWVYEHDFCEWPVAFSEHWTMTTPWPLLWQVIGTFFLRTWPSHYGNFYVDDIRLCTGRISRCRCL